MGLNIRNKKTTSLLVLQTVIRLETMMEGKAH